MTTSGERINRIYNKQLHEKFLNLLCNLRIRFKANKLFRAGHSLVVLDKTKRARAYLRNKDVSILPRVYKVNSVQHEVTSDN
jgi:hypothetical protein